ncbi:MAG: hypothetical protein H0X35_11800 [Pseudonocardiales bacterium]|nr:hypothetical protein [Pseudonocardiales bacterium]
MTTVTCPDCGRAAVVLGRFDRSSAGGPVEYLRIRCAGSLSLIVAAAEVEVSSSRSDDRVRGTRS